MSKSLKIINADISETQLLLSFGEKVCENLLKDHTTQQNIFWATDSYETLGEGYTFYDPITIEKITGENENVIRPRSVKSREEQDKRVKDKAEVFTPSWVCNAQNNLVDEAWFGRKDVFNKEIVTENGIHDWEPTEIIVFEGSGKTWEDYIRDTRMEITCGEGPYLVSRYDTTTGEEIPLNKRVGLLDRKMRVINENVQTLNEWKKWAKIAYRNIYGFEWQGDSLLLAREALLFTLLDYYEDIQKRLGLKIKKMPTATMQSFAYIISWNLWQMDGLKFVVPGSCHEETIHETTLFDERTYVRPCEGCKNEDPLKHNGVYCKIRDWGIFENDHKDKSGKIGKERCDIEFVKYVYKRQQKNK